MNITRIVRCVWEGIIQTLLFFLVHLLVVKNPPLAFTWSYLWVRALQRCVPVLTCRALCLISVGLEIRGHPGTESHITHIIKQQFTCRFLPLTLQPFTRSSRSHPASTGCVLCWKVDLERSPSCTETHMKSRSPDSQRFSVCARVVSSDSDFSLSRLPPTQALVYAADESRDTCAVSWPYIPE